MFNKVNSNVNFPELEEKLIKYWKDNKIFEKSIESRPADKTWTFLDGPPFVTGMPHYGSLLPRIAKDVFPRFWTMKGYRVRRVWGWDGHGLPVENKVESKLEIKRKKDIEDKIGIKKFIAECLAYVEQTSSEWEWYVDHIGEWIDFAHAYKTWDMPYMESVMWVFRQIYDKGFIYKGLRVSLYCPHCSTPISNFEVAMDADNYKDVTEPTAVYKYEIKEPRTKNPASLAGGQEPRTFLLAWSTTPWNKIATMALAVNPSLTYIKVVQGNDQYILAKSTIKMLTKELYKIIEEFPGKDLIGKKFIPHYDFYPIEKGKKAFEVVGGEFVTSDEGTGVVTIAAYGEEDLAVMLRDNIQLVLHVDDEGIIKKEVPKWAGMYYLKVDPLVIEDLQIRNLIYRVDSYTHSVPTCWRCHTRLYYGPQNAWYVNVQKLKKQMAKTNEEINWFPDHFKHGRFLKSLEAAPDWCISRSRYWGSPVPVWECEKCADRFVPGSIQELEDWSGAKVATLHKPDIDEIKGVCKKCHGTSRRVPEVLDSWIEAGSASFAERHFPFSVLKHNGIPDQVGDDSILKNELSHFFPPDFIVEYTGQIRAWFYVLHVITNAIYKSKAFKNAVVTGVIAGTDGRKMSKNYGNYPDPKEMLEKYGGDALRLYLLGSPVMKAEDMRISEENYRNEVRGMMLILWNVYNFFVTNSIVDSWNPTPNAERRTPNVLDQWILLLLNKLIGDVTDALESYDTISAVRSLEEFVTKLSQWYVRRSRDRVGPTVPPSRDKDDCYSTLYTVLVTLCQLAAPLVPFITEEMYRNLTGEESVHLTKWPGRSDKPKAISDKLVNEMDEGIKLASVVHAFRKEHSIKVRVPLRKLTYSGPIELSADVAKVVKEETNVYELSYDKKSDDFSVSGDHSLQNQDVDAGTARGLVRDIQKLRKEKGCAIDERVNVILPKDFQTLLKDHLDYIKRETLAKEVTWGETLAIL